VKSEISQVRNFAWCRVRKKNAESSRSRLLLSGSGVKRNFWPLRNFWPVIVPQLFFFSE